jgi:hypothetical protein
MEELVKAAVLDNDIEAQLVDSILNDQGIPHVMQSYHDTAYDGLFQTQRGWGQINAPFAFRDLILEVVAEVRRDAERSEDEKLRR